MSLRVITCLVLAVLLALAVVPAQAQRSGGSREKEALALFENSLVAYRAGRFQEGSSY